MDYDVRIYIDRLDGFYANGGEDPDTQTSGTLMLDGVEASWVIGLGDEKWYMPADPQVPRPEDSPDGCWAGEVGFDLLINGSRDFRSRADARDIDAAVVATLQDRHHPHHCDCQACEERHAIQVHRICGELQKEGLTVMPTRPTPVTIQLKELGL